MLKLEARDSSWPPLELADGLELAEGFAVARAVHGFLGLDQSIERQHAQFDAFDLDAQAGLFDLREAAEALDFTETIELAEVRVEVQILEVGGVRGSQLKRLAARRHAVDGMQIGQGPLQSQQVRHGEITAEIDILGGAGAAVDDAGVATDDHEVHAGTGKALQ